MKKLVIVLLTLIMSNTFVINSVFAADSNTIHAITTGNVYGAYTSPHPLRYINDSGAAIYDMGYADATGYHEFIFKNRPGFTSHYLTFISVDARDNKIWFMRTSHNYSSAFDVGYIPLNNPSAPFVSTLEMWSYINGGEMVNGKGYVRLDDGTLYIYQNNAWTSPTKKIYPTIDENGDIYAIDESIPVDGYRYGGLYKWNGSDWTHLNNNMNISKAYSAVAGVKMYNGRFYMRTSNYQQAYISSIDINGGSYQSNVIPTYSFTLADFARDPRTGKLGFIGASARGSLAVDGLTRHLYHYYMVGIGNTGVDFDFIGYSLTNNYSTSMSVGVLGSGTFAINTNCGLYIVKNGVPDILADTANQAQLGGLINSINNIKSSVDAANNNAYWSLQHAAAANTNSANANTKIDNLTNSVNSQIGNLTTNVNSQISNVRTELTNTMSDRFTEVLTGLNNLDKRTNTMSALTSLNKYTVTTEDTIRLAISCSAPPTGVAFRVTAGSIPQNRIRIDGTTVEINIKGLAVSDIPGVISVSAYEGSTFLQKKEIFKKDYWFEVVTID